MRVWLCALIACAACGGDEETSAGRTPEPPRDPLPATSLGPYAVGVTTMDVSAGDRTLPMEIWYPAEPSDAAPERYQLKLGALVVVEADSGVGAVRDAALDLRGAPHPVVMFSHGSGGTRIQSLYLTEYLASHGFVVAAPDHVGNTFAEEVNEAAQLPRIEAARLRPEDMRAGLDALLARGDTAGDLLELAVDPARIGIAGHSFGGFTSLRIAGAHIDVGGFAAECASDPEQLICDGYPPDGPFDEIQRDERVVAAVAQAPGGAVAMGSDGFGAVAIPTMIQAGTADWHTPYDSEAAAPYAQLPSPAWLLTLDGAGHFTFSDMCWLLEALGLTIEDFDDGCADTNLPIDDAHPLIQAATTAFLRQTVAGDLSFPGELEKMLPDFATMDHK